jgi:hypothetical protein
MSASPPKADIGGATSYVRFGPKADIGTAKSHVRFTPKADIPAETLDDVTGGLSFGRQRS